MCRHHRCPCGRPRQSTSGSSRATAGSTSPRFIASSAASGRAGSRPRPHCRLSRLSDQGARVTELVAKIRRVEEQPRSRSEDAALVAAGRALTGGGPRAVVLVEGVSDQGAVEALAERHGRDLHTERISVVPIGGAQAIGQFLNLFGPAGLDVRLAGICDAGRGGRLPPRPRAGRHSVSGSPASRWSGWASSSARPTWRTS